MQNLSPANIKKIIVETLEDNKATDVVALNIKHLTDIADYMIVCTGNSTTHVKALTDKIREKLLPSRIKPIGIEGSKSNEWMLVDFGNIIVHIMLKQEREFYNLEKLWGISKFSKKDADKSSDTPKENN